MKELFVLSQTCLNKLERAVLGIITLASHYYLKNLRKKITQACALSLSYPRDQEKETVSSLTPIRSHCSTVAMATMSVFLDIQTENSKHLQLDCGQVLCVTRSESSQIICLYPDLATRGYQRFLMLSPEGTKERSSL